MKDPERQDQATSSMVVREEVATHLETNQDQRHSSDEIHLVRIEYSWRLLERGMDEPQTHDEVATLSEASDTRQIVDTILVKVFFTRRFGHTTSVVEHVLQFSVTWSESLFRDNGYDVALEIYSQFWELVSVFPRLDDDLTALFSVWGREQQSPQHMSLRENLTSWEPSA